MLTHLFIIRRLLEGVESCRTCGEGVQEDGVDVHSRGSQLARCVFSLKVWGKKEIGDGEGSSGNVSL